jgi:putative transcriptional regulator
VFSRHGSAIAAVRTYNDRMRRSLTCAALVVAALFATAATWPARTLAEAVATRPAQVLRSPLAGRYGDVEDLKPGAMLVASRELSDPNFVRTVILLVLYNNDDGAMGLIVNRRTSVPLGRLFESVEGAGDHTALVYAGGPVSPTSAQALVRSASPVPDGRPVVGEVHVLGSALALTRRVSGPIDEHRLRVYLGYSGWSPGQLEGEVRRGSWHIFEGDASIVFDRDPDTLWTRQIRRVDVQRAGAAHEPRQMVRNTSFR